MIILNLSTGEHTAKTINNFLKSAMQCKKKTFETCQGIDKIKLSLEPTVIAQHFCGPVNWNNTPINGKTIFIVCPLEMENYHKVNTVNIIFYTNQYYHRI